jgi:hypothetical protein
MKRHTIRRATLVLGAIMLLWSCTDEQPAVFEPQLSEGGIEPGAAIPVDMLASALAKSLATDGRRAAIHRSLRDSPFAKHRVHGNSYFAQGGMLVALAAELGMSTGEFASSLATTSAFEVVMPTISDRISWSGSPDLVVTGFDENQPLGEPLRGFGVAGDTVTIFPWQVSDRPILLVRPITSSFGADPETLRRGAPVNSRATISTRTEEGLVVTEQAPATLDEAPTSSPSRTEIGCWDEFGNYIECPPDPPPPGFASYELPSGYTMAQCTGSFSASVDSDRDGVLDQCEVEIARAFRPVLSLSPSDGTKSREPYWAVKSEAGYLKILYGLAYHADGGWGATPFSSHLGDSEFIVLWVHNTYQNKWNMTSAFLSAHHGTSVEGSTSLGWGEPAWTWPLGERGRPLVWVAEEKHANYISKYVCGSGGWLNQDDCDSNIFSLLSTAYEVQTIPSANFEMVNCVGSRQGKPGTECLRNYYDKFDGWNNTSGGVTPYGEILYEFDYEIVGLPIPEDPGGGNPPPDDDDDILLAPGASTTGPVGSGGD